MSILLPALQLCLLHLWNRWESNQILYLEEAGAIPKGRVLGDNRLAAPRTACQLVVIFSLPDQSTWNQDNLLWYFPEAASSKLRETPGRASTQEVQSVGWGVGGEGWSHWHCPLDRL